VTRDDFNEADRAALDLALESILTGKDQDRVAQLRAMLAESWWEAASFASYSKQIDHLQLAPWEDPPSAIDVDQLDAIIARGPNANNQYGGARLLKKMLAANVNPYHPSPISALAEATKRG
jgi:hypothetical protein